MEYFFCAKVLVIPQTVTDLTDIEHLIKSTENSYGTKSLNTFYYDDTVEFVEPANLLPQILDPPTISIPPIKSIQVFRGYNTGLYITCKPISEILKLINIKTVIFLLDAEYALSDNIQTTNKLEFTSLDPNKIATLKTNYQILIDTPILKFTHVILKCDANNNNYFKNHSSLAFHIKSKSVIVINCQITQLNSHETSILLFEKCDDIQLTKNYLTNSKIKFDSPTFVKTYKNYIINCQLEYRLCFFDCTKNIIVENFRLSIFGCKMCNIYNNTFSCKLVNLYNNISIDYGSTLEGADSSCKGGSRICDNKFAGSNVVFTDNEVTINSDIYTPFFRIDRTSSVDVKNNYFHDVKYLANLSCESKLFLSKNIHGHQTCEIVCYDAKYKIYSHGVYKPRTQLVISYFNYKTGKIMDNITSNDELLPFTFYPDFDDIYEPQVQSLELGSKSPIYQLVRQKFNFDLDDINDENIKVITEKMLQIKTTNTNYENNKDYQKLRNDYKAMYKNKNQYIILPIKYRDINDETFEKIQNVLNNEVAVADLMSLFDDIMQQELIYVFTTRDIMIPDRVCVTYH